MNRLQAGTALTTVIAHETKHVGKIKLFKLLYLLDFECRERSLGQDLAGRQRHERGDSLRVGLDPDSPLRESILETAREREAIRRTHPSHALRSAYRNGARSNPPPCPVLPKRRG